MKSNIIVFEGEVYNQMIEEIKKTVVETLSHSKKEDEWINAEEAKKILNIKSKSKQTSFSNDFW